MLFIWDLHLKTDKKEEIFSKLTDILDNTESKDIVFLWDYIYHSAYNPKILWDFFDLCLDYSKNWKNIYILAGNHDYVKWHFVFAEAEKLTNITDGPLHIISQPQIQIIYNKKVLFFPFYTRIAEEEEFIQIDKKIKSLKNHKQKDLLLNLFVVAYQNWKEDEKNLKISWTINLDLVKFILENEDIDIFVHHFYTVNTAFPWQFAKFSFKNIALSDQIFKADFQIISGHLHKSFRHKNYTCVGSFWNTSPLEENDTKVVFTYPDKFQQVVINPYISFEIKDNKQIETTELKNKWEDVEAEAEELLNTKILKDKFDLKKVELVLKSKDFVNVKEIVSPELLNKIKNVKYRQITGKTIWNIINELEINHEKLGYSFESWKQLSKDFIEKKYPEKKSEYFKILEDLDLM